jgi:zinc protease
LLAALAALGLLSGQPPRSPGREKKRGRPALDALLHSARSVYAGLRTATLDNGLRVYLLPVSGSGVVTTMTAYRVGSADEDLDHTGLSHYLEHLMFKGTAKLLPGDIDRLVQRNGGTSNAYTTEDFTAYHFDFASDHYPIALEIEADRMRNLRIDAKHEFQQEKGAVIAEVKRYEDQPWDLEQKAMLPLLFGKKTPYGHPILGEEEHVRAATAKVIKTHYDKWYHPNNAALILCGGFDSDEALARIKKLFGPIPRAKLPPRKQAPERKRGGPVRKEMTSKFEVPRLLLGYPGGRSGAKDFYALEVIQELLSGGKTARLYKKLVEGDKVANSVSSANTACRYPGWLSVQVEFLQGQGVKQGEKLVLAELERLQKEQVSDAELKRVRRRMLANTIFGRESVHDLADSLARGVMVNDLNFLKTYLAKVTAVTAADVRRVARKYYDPKRRVTVVSIPRKKAKGGGGSKEDDGVTRKKAYAAQGVGLAKYRVTPSRRPRSSNKGGGAFSFQKMQKVVLDNGLTLLLLENHRLPIVAAQAQVRHVSLFEPEGKGGLAVLTGRMLDQGTARHTGPQLAEAIENVGGSLEMSSGGGSVKVLAPDRRLGLGLLFECLAEARFPKDKFTSQRRRLLSTIDDDAQDPDKRARQLFQKLVYGNQPLGRPPLGTHKSVAALTAAECRAFYRRVFVPNNTLLAVVGDFDSKEVVAEVKRLTAHWRPAGSGDPRRPLPKPRTPKIPPLKSFTRKIITMPEAAQLHVYLGHLGIRRANPDYYKLLVMDNVLGTGEGFTDRLSARLRDRLGLAYRVTANLTATAGEEPGIFTAYIGTRPDKLELVRKVFLEEIDRLRREKPTSREVVGAKKYLLGSLPFRFTTNELVAGELLNNEQYRLGRNYLAEYRKAVAAVTPADVRVVAVKYLHPKHLALVAAGAVDQSGKPLKKISPSRKGRE